MAGPEPITLHQPGLEWKRNLFDYEAHWTKEPQVGVVKDIACKTLHQDHCTVEFRVQGAFNKIYMIHCERGDFVMRVSLPVDPHYKTLSEVATIDFVCKNTDIPVPKVFAYDASNDNDLEFEWILMEAVQGEDLREKWKFMSLAAKKVLVKRLAHFSAQLFRHKFDYLGNLYPKVHLDETLQPPDASLANASKDFFVDRMVSMEFFLADRRVEDVQRGPFKSSQEWLSAKLRLHQNDCERILKTSDDEDDLELAKETAQLVQRLSSLMPTVYPFVPGGRGETTALLHDDMGPQNIMVDEDGNLSAIIDWESVSALPLWKVCQLPKLLEGSDRKESPEEGNYLHDENGPNEVFWEHKLEYEQTILREIFLDEMRKIEPEWVEVFSNASNQRKADFELAVTLCNDEASLKFIDRWLREFSKSKQQSRLRDRLRLGKWLTDTS